MFPYADPQARIDLYRQHVADMVREAGDHRRARTVGRRFGRWRRRRPGEAATG
jgi:hypothetical protein